MVELTKERIFFFFSRKIRLDVENSSSIKFIEKKSSSSSSFVSRLDDELNEIPRGVFFIERISTERLDEDFLKKFGLTLRCQLIGNDFPLIPSLNLRISIDYPNEQPEILSLTKTSPPKLVFTDENPHLERISTYFICRLFKLERQHRIIDLLNIWVKNSSMKRSKKNHTRHLSCFRFSVIRSKVFCEK